MNTQTVAADTYHPTFGFCKAIAAPTYEWLTELSPAAVAIYCVTMTSAVGQQASPTAADKLGFPPDTLKAGWEQLQRAGALVLLQDALPEPRVLLSSREESGRFLSAHDGNYSIYSDRLTKRETQLACSSIEQFRAYVTLGRNVLNGADPACLEPTILDWTGGNWDGSASMYIGYAAFRLTEKALAKGKPIIIPDWWELDSHVGWIIDHLGEEPDDVVPEIDRHVEKGMVWFCPTTYDEGDVRCTAVSGTACA